MRHLLETSTRTLLAVTALLSSLASAQQNTPGSLLVFPEFDNRTGVTNVLTVTNLSPDQSIKVEFVYIGRRIEKDVEIPCGEFNRTDTLTPKDTFTFLTKDHNPELEQGFVFAFAKDVLTNEPVAFDHLVGTSLKVDTILAFDYGINPMVFQAGSGLNELEPTDLDADRLRDLDGAEYSPAPDRIVIPRFLGQASSYTSYLHLVGLSGTRFDTTLDFLIYNDNEEVFSTEYTFRCWDRVWLKDISNLFDNAYLRDFTNQDPNEVLGAPAVEAGWMEIDGGVASSLSTSIDDPAFLAFLSEGVETLQVADLPFTIGTQTNGSLLSRALSGDTDR